MSAPPGSPPIAPPTPEQQAALILASIVKGATIGVAYLGVAISAMYVPSVVARRRLVGSRLSCNVQDLWRDVHPDVPVLPVGEGEGRRDVPSVHCMYIRSLLVLRVLIVDDAGGIPMVSSVRCVLSTASLR